MLLALLLASAYSLRITTGEDFDEDFQCAEGFQTLWETHNNDGAMCKEEYERLFDDVEGKEDVLFPNMNKDLKHSDFEQYWNDEIVQYIK